MRRLIPLLLLACSLVLPRFAIAADGGHIRVRALLVIASNQRGESDSRLSSYVPTLRRILRFESYRLVGEGSANVTGAGKTAVNLGRGHSLDLEGGGSLRVNWKENGRSLINTSLSLRSGVPAVLGGPGTGKEGEVWAVILVTE
jgi:hypothetical protein